MYREGMAISKDMGDLRALAWSANLQGIVCWATGEYKEGFNLYEEGLFLYREVGDRRGEAWTLDLMGNIKLAQREDEEAEKLYTQAYSLVVKEGVNLQNVAWNDYHLGTIALFRGDIDQAKGRFEKALSVFERLEDSLGQAVSLIHLGEVACGLGEIERTENHLKRAVDLALRARSTPILADLLTAVARLLKAQGKERDAFSFLMAALSHPTCRRQTKDRVVSLSMELKSSLDGEEVEGITRWAKGASLEKVITSWAASARSSRSPTRPKAKAKVKPKVKRKAKPARKPKKKKRRG
jgi:ATP/maltotriose-dependent transcriptional regulator MalT